MTVIRNMKMDKPIIQGGMGVGVSLGNLAGAVAYNGGMGVISTVNAGFREPDFDTNPVAANLRALKSEIKKAKDISKGNGIVGINIMVAVNHYEETVKAAVEAGVQAIISGAGLPTELPKYVGDADVALAPIVSSGKAASTVLRYWNKKYNRIPDFIVIEGSLAGGHLGFKRDEVVNKTAMSLDDILGEVKTVTTEYEALNNTKIPIFVGGGVFDSKDISHFMELGASGVQIGTRFILTEECDASDEYKKVLLNAKAEDIAIIHSPVGMPGRALRTKLIEEIDAGKVFLPKICNDCLKACPHGKNVIYCISKALIDAVNGHLDTGLFFCGANVGRINKMTTVAGLMQELTQDN